MQATSCIPWADQPGPNKQVTIAETLKVSAHPKTAILARGRGKANVGKAEFRGHFHLRESQRLKSDLTTRMGNGVMAQDLTNTTDGEDNSGPPERASGQTRGLQEVHGNLD